MTTETVHVQYLYRSDPPSLREVYDALATYERVDLWTARAEIDFDEWGTVHYDCGPVSASASVSDSDAGIPRGDNEGSARLRLSHSEAGLADDEREVSAERCRHLVDLTGYLYGAVRTRPALVCSTSPTFEATLSPLPGSDESGPRAYVTWLDIYPPAEVETVGRDTLLSAPAPRVEELDDGSVLVASKHPLETSEARLEQVGAHLGIPTWLDRVY